MDNDIDSLDHGWTIEEIDLLTSWWGELEGRSDAIEEVARRLMNKGIRKLKIEVRMRTAMALILSPPTSRIAF